MRAVVFDLFHTLVDPEEFRPPDFDRAGRAAEILGIGSAALRVFWERELLDLVASSSDPAERAASYARDLGHEVRRRQVAAVSDALGRYQSLALERPIAGAVPAPTALREAGLRLGLLSNAHTRDVVGWVTTPLAPCLDATVFSCLAGVAKPDPAACDAMLGSLGVVPAEAAFVADGGSGELDGVRRHGFGLVVLVAGPALRSGLRSEGEVAGLEREADLRIDSVVDLTDLVAMRTMGFSTGWGTSRDTRQRCVLRLRGSVVERAGQPGSRRRPLLAVTGGSLLRNTEYWGCVPATLGARYCGNSRRGVGAGTCARGTGGSGDKRWAMRLARGVSAGGSRWRPRSFRVSSRIRDDAPHHLTFSPKKQTRPSGRVFVDQGIRLSPKCSGGSRDLGQATPFPAPERGSAPVTTEDVLSASGAVPAPPVGEPGTA